MIKKIWAYLTLSCERCSRIRLMLGAGVIVAMFSGLMMIAGAAGLAWTNTEQFCIGCHEMRDNVYAEFKGTIHDTNRSGVRAVCADCHVPRAPGPMLKRKVEATFELWGHFVTGVIDNKEKFEKHRYDMAKRVWTRMKETDSLECRNCHNAESMNAALQSERAKARHAKGKKDGMTCIDCHFGIAHKEPDGPGPRELKVSKK